MASAHPASASAPQPAPVPQPTASPTNTAASQAASPAPSKQNLRSWWKTFSKTQRKDEEIQGNSPQLSYRLKFTERPMDKEILVAEEVPGWLPELASDASEHVISCQQMAPRARGPRMARTPPSGRQVPSGSERCKCSVPPQDGPLPFGRRVATFLLVVMRLKHEHKLSKERKFAKQKAAAEPTGIFGVPLRQSITYANVAISLVDAEGKSYIYGYVPIVVAKCGVFLKEKATNVEGIFRLSGAEKRIKELVVIFDSPDRYGKGLDWDGYTVHDAANVLRRYLNQLPEPIVPLDLYDRFRDPLRDHEASQKSGDFDLDATILKYQQLITELPPLNRQLLLYILDLLAVFASKSDENRMNSQNLAAIFQPGMLSHPAHDMAPAEYRLSQDVLVFLIENQDHFLIGMRGTAADEKTVQDVQNGGTPPLSTPSTPTPGKGNNTVGRSASNASAGADSLRRQGGVRRNVSVNSRHSRQSNGAPSPASPAFGQPLTQTSSGGVHRSNTVPSKKSPGLGSARLQKPLEGRSPTSPASPAFQQTVVASTEAQQEPVTSPETDTAPAPALAPAPAITPSKRDALPMSTSWMHSNTAKMSSLIPTSEAVTAGQSQDRLLPDSTEVKPETTTPGRERRFFQRSPTAESDQRQPNKLKKKRNISSNPSAQSSSNSLNGQSGNVSPAMPTTHASQDIVEYPHLASIPSGDPTISHTEASPVIDQQQGAGNLKALPSRPEEVHRSSDGTLKPQYSSQSLRSREESMNEQSDMEPTDDPVVAAEQKEKRRRWRLSRRKDESLGANLTSPKKAIGSNGGADTSTTSFSSGRGRKSFTADTVAAGSDSGMASTYQQTSNDSGLSHEPGGKEKEEKKVNPIDWFKRKMHEAEEKKRERDAEKEKERFGKGERRIPTGNAPGGKSMDLRRSAEEDPETIGTPDA